MFPRNKVNLLYRLLCLIAFLMVIIFIKSNITLIIIAVSFYILTITERRIENIFLYAVTIVVFIMCLVINNYFLLRIVTIIDFLHYFLNNDTLDDEIEEDIKRDEHYIRFEKKERKVVDNNRLCTIFVLVHMVLLLIAIVVF